MTSVTKDINLDGVRDKATQVANNILNHFTYLPQNQKVFDKLRQIVSVGYTELEEQCETYRMQIESLEYEYECMLDEIGYMNEQ